eukprot:g2156.t1
MLFINISSVLGSIWDLVQVLFNPSGSFLNFTPSGSSGLVPGFASVMSFAGPGPPGSPRCRYCCSSLYFFFLSRYKWRTSRIYRVHRANTIPGISGGKKFTNLKIAKSDIVKIGKIS